jgi:hypothetical protein
MSQIIESGLLFTICYALVHCTMYSDAFLTRLRSLLCLAYAAIELIKQVTS